MTRPVLLLRLWAPAALWCLLIFLMSSIPDLNSGLKVDYPLRKVAHMTEFGILYVLTRRALDGSLPPSRLSLARPAAWLFCLMYAMSDEWHQSFVPGRAGLWSDVAIDSAGALAAAAYESFRRRY